MTIGNQLQPSVTTLRLAFEPALSPGEVRALILAQHERIRGLLRNVGIQATRLLAMPVAARRERDATRKLALNLCAVMATHIEFENRVLCEALRRNDVWGDVRAEQLRADHAEQLQLLHAYALALREDGLSGAALGAAACQLVELISADMNQEEATVLGEELLSDEVIDRDVETG